MVMENSRVAALSDVYRVLGNKHYCMIKFYVNLELISDSADDLTRTRGAVIVIHSKILRII